MEADFSGYATKNGLKCSDGRTILPDAFKHHDGTRVPLVWSHMHDGAENVLGHAILENRADGVYTYGFFNDSDTGKHAKAMVQHGDINALSIFANNLIERGKSVVHGDLHEVSLVLTGANPGALIDSVNLAHGEGSTAGSDEGIIYTGLYLEHSDITNTEGATVATETETETQSTSNSEKTVQDVVDSMTDEQKKVLYYLVAEASEMEVDDDVDEEITTGGELSQSAIAHINNTIKEGIETMGRNVFDQNNTSAVGSTTTLTHSQLSEIVSDAQRLGSLKESFIAHAGDYGIDDIEHLFPDAQTIANTPEFLQRRTEWVANVLGTTKHSPFSRIKSIVADITAEEARAKGYVKGNVKKDEVIKLLKRSTTPTTVYKKQKLDRDDIIDITDLDVVTWLKSEMRLMLEEEIARAILIGDGREPDDDDKIDEDHVRPIAFDNDMYAHKVNLSGGASGHELIEAVLRARVNYKGTGTPTFYTTDAILTDLILLKDKVNRRLYETEESLAAALRVSKIVAVEAMESSPEILGIMVNLQDYTIGADKGGQTEFFDDFDIDYNQYKYLLESRISGALTKPKSAVIIKTTVGTVVTPATPTYNNATHTITIPSTTGVTYYIDDVVKTGNVVIAETSEVEARPNSGYSFPHNIDTDWTFIYTA